MVESSEILVILVKNRIGIKKIPFSLANGFALIDSRKSRCESPVPLRLT